LSWNKQELAKREAEFSFEMLKSVVAAQRCFEAALPVVGPATFEADRVLSFAKNMLTTLEQCNGSFSKLTADIAVAKHFLGDAVDQDASDLDYLITNTISSVRSVSHFVEAERHRNLKEPNYAQMALAVLERLGHYKWGESYSQGVRDLVPNEASPFMRSKSISERLIGGLVKKISLSEAGLRLW
jgi:hypothetical protein